MTEVVEYVRAVCAEHDRIYGPPGEDPFERRRRELAEIAKREQPRKPDAPPPIDWAAVYAAIDARLEQHFLDGENGIGGVLKTAVGRALGETARDLRKQLRGEMATLEDRLKSSPGKLPVAKTWCPESVTYQAEFVCHDGALWQACKDTAQAPGGSDWICVARAGRDGASCATPSLRGKFNAHKTYTQLDVVEFEGSSFLAIRDNPGVPGLDDGWQVLCSRGDRGVAGDVGPQGPRGERGRCGEAAPSIVSWVADPVHYRLHPVLSNGKPGAPIELRGLLQQFLNEALVNLVDQAVKDAMRSQP